MSIRDWPKSERPREKLINLGSQALSDAELLAIFIRTGIAGTNALDMARQLLSETGSLRALMNLSPQELYRFKGFGPAKYVEFQASLELGRRYLKEKLEEGEMINNPQACREYLKMCLRDKAHEVFFAIFLDTKHKVIQCGELFRGTIDNASVPIREVVKEALKHNAAAMIVAHNHPSGVADPSRSDVTLTQNMSSALALVGVKLLDHLVIGETEVISLAEMNAFN